jgi:hypothetical protein
MQTYDDLIELARICARHAQLAPTKEIARELWKMANLYRTRAIALDGEKLIDIGQPPALLSE